MTPDINDLEALTAAAHAQAARDLGLDKTLARLKAQDVVKATHKGVEEAREHLDEAQRKASSPLEAARVEYDQKVEWLRRPVAAALEKVAAAEAAHANALAELDAATKAEAEHGTSLAG